MSSINPNPYFGSKLVEFSFYKRTNVLLLHSEEGWSWALNSSVR